MVLVSAQIEDFKDLLYTAVDKKKALAEKIDANCEQISRLGADKHIPIVRLFGALIANSVVLAEICP
jgi:hypothetical protein